MAAGRSGSHGDCDPLGGSGGQIHAAVNVDPRCRRAELIRLAGYDDGRHAIVQLAYAWIAEVEKRLDRIRSVVSQEDRERSIFSGQQGIW
jgi:hypothetical protein